MDKLISRNIISVVTSLRNLILIAEFSDLFVTAIHWNCHVVIYALYVAWNLSNATCWWRGCTNWVRESRPFHELFAKHPKFFVSMATPVNSIAGILDKVDLGVKLRGVSYACKRLSPCKKPSFKRTVDESFEIAHSQNLQHQWRSAMTLIYWNCVSVGWSGNQPDRFVLGIIKFYTALSSWLRAGKVCLSIYMRNCYC